ncbi:MAG: RluA family pseudouridine synthase [Pirellulaceae bacterium]|nr:RluA family pseudouridine synthase [Pirellulaceae bacterium]
MIVQFTVTEQIPFPARTVLGVVQAALKVKRTVAQQLVHEHAVSCRGRILLHGHQHLQVGDMLEIDYAPQPIKIRTIKTRQVQRFEIVYDDADFVVVNKPAGVLTVPTTKGESNTLQSQLRGWLNRQQPGAMAVCVHRLDRLVSGLLVFAKTYPVADLLRTQFASRKPQRLYTAFVSGQVAEDQGTIRNYLATNEQLTRYSSDNPQAGELAITHYRVIERWRDITQLEVRLETGRRNQIRVHLAEHGHPILGDPRYGPEEAQHRLWPYKRIALHAETLSILHPQTGQLLRLVAPWPQEFRDLKRKLTPRAQT